MANTYSQVYHHFVFTVKYRNALLHHKWRQNFFGVMGNLINDSGCKTIIVNGVEDHVHCLVGIKPSVSSSDLMKSVKSKSSKYINDHKLTPEKFEWQDGFGVFSYGQSQLDIIYKYIKNQEEHHKKKTAKEEYLEFLNDYNIDFNEDYIFKELE